MNGEQQLQSLSHSFPQLSSAQEHLVSCSTHVSCSNAGAVHISIIKVTNMNEIKRMSRVCRSEIRLQRYKKWLQRYKKWRKIKKQSSCSRDLRYC